MRRLIRPLFTAAVFAALATPALNAQSPTIGFKLGPSFSTLSHDEQEDLKTLTKFTGGGFVRFDMGGFAIQPELMYVTKGAKFSATEENVTVDGELALDYVEVPLLFVLPFSAGANIAPHVYAGPAFAFEVGCSTGISGGGIDVSVDCDESDEDFDRRKFDIGAMVGGGLSIAMGPGALLLEGRYNFGLLNLNNNDSESFTMRNRSGAVLVGYSIPIGQRY